jgi:hypothetical protein
MVYKSNKRSDVFQRDMYDQAMKMAMGENGEFGGTTEYNGNDIHIPNWLERDEFEDLMTWLSSDPNNLKKATGYYIDGKDEFGGEAIPGKPMGKYGDEHRDLDIFKGGEPVLISVGYGKYKVAMGQHPSKGDPDYAIDGNFINEGNNHLIIDLNKIKYDWENSK